MSFHVISDFSFARRVACSVGSFFLPVFYCLLAHSFVWPLASGFSLRRVFPLYCFGLLPLSLENRILKVSFGDCSAGTAGGWWVAGSLAVLLSWVDSGLLGLLLPVSVVESSFVLFFSLCFRAPRSCVVFGPVGLCWGGSSPLVTGSIFWNFSARRFS